MQSGPAGSPGPVGAGPGRVLCACALVGLVVGAWAALAIGARAKEGEQVMADEPQYLLSALSLWEDRDLHIDDELAAERYRPFYDIVLPVQTQPLADGHAVSPHDPLLPALLAVPMGLGGWVAAKATLAGLGGVLAGLLVWVAHRRFAVPLGVAAGTVLAFGLTAPLTAYSTQVYPELPAALAVTLAIACLTAPPPPAGATAAAARGGRSVEPSPGAGPVTTPGAATPARDRRPTIAGARKGAWHSLCSPGFGWGAAVVALPWLGVKYAPVAGVLALLGLGQLVRSWRVGAAVGAAVGLAAAGGGYLLAHRLLYGGWTVYAAGDHFAAGELTVMGRDPDYVGRSQRTIGLLLDRGFGLAAWMPGYLLMVPALAVVVRRRPPGWATLVLPFAAGWATATWVALTMHGWWWPGRQTVVVLPCVVLAMAWWIGRERTLLAGRRMLAVAAALGAVTWLWLVVEVLQRRSGVTLIGGFESTGNPLYGAWRTVLPDLRHPAGGDRVLAGVWLVVLAVATVAALRTGSLGGLPDPSTDRPHRPGETDETGRAGGAREARRPHRVPA